MNTKVSFLSRSKLLLLGSALFLSSMFFGGQAKADNTAVTGLTATAATSSVQLNWAWGGGDETNFGIEYSLTSDFSANTSSLGAAATTTLTTTTPSTLTPNTQYWFKVTAFGGAGAPAVATTSAYTSSTLPLSPTASAVSTSSIALSWGDNGNASTTIYRVTGNNGFSAVTTTATSSVPLTGLTPNTSYTFTVAAYDLASSAYGTGVAASATYTIPTPPLSATPGAVTTSTILLSWGDNSNPSTTVYSIMEPDVVPSFTTVTTTGTSTTLTGLTPNTSYTFTVRAIYASDNVSETAVGTTAASAYTSSSLPLSPTVSAITTSSVALSWGSNSNPTTTVYRVSGDNGFTSVTTTATSSVPLTGLTSNTSYTFTVAAYDLASSAYSTEVAASATTTLTNTSSITLSSVASSTIGFSVGSDNNSTSTQYDIKVEYGVTTRYVGAAGGLVGAPVTKTAAEWSAIAPIYLLTPNTLYTTSIRAWGTQNTTGYSTTSATTTLASNPTSPTVSSVSTSSVSISWGENSNPTTTVYRVNGNNSFTSVTTTATSTSLTGLTPNQSYTFNVQSQNSGDSSYNSVVAASATTTVPLNPTSPTVSSLSTSTLTLSWGANGNSTSSVYQISATDFTTVTTTATTSAITGLTPNTGYTFTVKTFYASDNSTLTSGTDATATTTLFQVPTSAAASSVSTSSVVVSWGANGNNTRTIYEISDPDASPSFTTVTSTGTSTAITGLYPNTSYSFNVKAQHSEVPTTLSNASTASAIVTLANVPSITSVEGFTNTQIQVVLSGDASQYLIAKSDGTTLSDYSASTTVTISNLTCNTTFLLKVKGKNSSAVETAFSDTTSFTTGQCSSGGGSGGGGSSSPVVVPVVVTPAATSSVEVVVTPVASTSSAVVVAEPELSTPPVSAPVPMQFTLSNPDSKLVILPVKQLEYKPNSSVKYTYSYKNETTKPVKVNIVRQVVDQNGKVVNQVTGTRTLSKGQTLKFNATSALSSKLANGTYTVKVQVLDAKKAVLAENSFDVMVKKPLPPPSIVTSDPDSKVVITGLKVDYKPGSAVKYTYSYKNETTKPVKVNIVRQVVDQNGKVVNQVTGTRTLSKGQTLKFNATSALSSKLANGTYTVKVQVLDAKKAVLAENSFDVMVKK